VLRSETDDSTRVAAYGDPMGATPKRAVALGALALGAFQVIGSFGAADNQPDRMPMDALAVLLVLLGPAALAWRDRWPLIAVGVAIGAADVYVGLGYAYGPIFVSVVVALFSAVQSGRRRQTWLLAAAGFVGFSGAHMLDDHADTNLGHLGLVAGWLAVVLALSEVVRSRREQAAERERTAADEQRLSLAQELHDVLAHNLSLIHVQASVALHLAEADNPTAPALTAIKQASRESLHELRTALDVLRRGEAAPRAPAPRLADLDELVDGVRSSGLDVRLTVRVGDSLPAAVELAAYRIVQEALTNVTRHAHASRAMVHIEQGDGVGVEVVDDGIAGGAAEPGNGIRGMRERAEALGGTVEAGPGPDGGFRVAADLPVRR
jgi:signal transduction histidine kinase